MLPCELFIKLKQHMNMEYRSAGVYIATSSWFFEHDFIELAQASRALAQYSVTRVMRFYDFLNHCQQNPFICQETPSPHMSVLSLDSIIHDILLDYRTRNDGISEMENISIITNNIKTKLFIEKIKPYYLEEADFLLFYFKDYILLNKIKLESEDYSLSEIAQISEPLHCI